MDWLKNLLFEILQAIYSVVGDYGVAIVGLTLLVRLLLLPLTLKQTRSMYELQRIQPKMKELQEKYKNDKAKLQEETLKFYQENKVNPFGGCLPLLLQMPVFIALFSILGKGGQLEEAASTPAFWKILPDLTQSAGAMFEAGGIAGSWEYVLFVLLFGAATVVPQLLQPGGQAQQRQMAIIMGGMMLFFGWSVYAGVVLYWVTSSLLGVAQQLIQTRVYKAREDVA